MYWTRDDLKLRAKQELHRYYWLAFVVCLIATILGGDWFRAAQGGNSSWHLTINGPIPGTVFTFGTIGALLGLAYTFFVEQPILVGKCVFFCRAPSENGDISDVFFAFRSQRYLCIVKTMFFVKLRIFLWMLLLLVPGIIKFYEYRMVPYILGESPEIAPEEAMCISREMTDNEKMAMFVLDLSFLGWFFLGAVCFGVGILFVQPYYEATYAQLYFDLRQKYFGTRPA